MHRRSTTEPSLCAHFLYGHPYLLLILWGQCHNYHTYILLFPPQTNVYWFFYNNVTLDCPPIHWLLLLLLLHLLLNQRWGWGWSWAGCGMCLHILKQLGQLPYTHLVTCLLKLGPALCHELVVSGYCMNSCKLQKVHVFLISSTSSTCVPFKASHCIHCIFDILDMNSCSTIFDLNPPVTIFRCLSLASS